MTHSAQAGARRLIPLLAAGLGIAIAVMAFAPAATSPPPGAAVGVHEANYETETDWYSPGEHVFRVHTAVRLCSRGELETLAYLLDGGNYAAVRDTVLAAYGDEIKDGRALALLGMMADPIDPEQGLVRGFRVNREYRGVPGYYFHVFYEFAVGYEDVLEIPELLWAGDYVGVVGRVTRALGFEPLRGTVSAGVLAQVTAPYAP